MAFWIADKVQGDYDHNTYFVIECVRQTTKVISVFTYSGAQLAPETPPYTEIAIFGGLGGRAAAGVLGVINTGFEPSIRGNGFPLVFP